MFLVLVIFPFELKSHVVESRVNEIIVKRCSRINDDNTKHYRATTMTMRRRAVRKKK